jgi:hypothetical protein
MARTGPWPNAFGRIAYVLLLEPAEREELYLHAFSEIYAWTRTLYKQGEIKKGGRSSRLFH